MWWSLRLICVLATFKEFLVRIVHDSGNASGLNDVSPVWRRDGRAWWEQWKMPVELKLPDIVFLSQVLLITIQFSPHFCASLLSSSLYSLYFSRPILVLRTFWQNGQTSVLLEQLHVFDSLRHLCLSNLIWKIVKISSLDFLIFFRLYLRPSYTSRFISPMKYWFSTWSPYGIDFPPLCRIGEGMW